MEYGRNDYQHIQDATGEIPKDEPVFLLRGQDKHAADTLRYYASCVAEANGDPVIVNGALAHADLMDSWPVNKAPDV